MSGHPAYAWGNPPTLRRSSFPQRASRPAGGPIPKHAWGCAPRPPNASEPPARKAKGRLPGAGLDDAYKVPQAHFYVGTADRVPLPRCGEGGRGCGAERRLWRMQRGGAPAAVEKIEQASSAKIFSGTARRQGLRLAEEGPLRQPNSPLFPIDSPALFDYYGVGKYPPKGVLKYE